MQSPIMPLPHRRGQLRREIAHLIGVRQQHEIRLRAFDHLAQRDAIAVRRVFLEQIVLDQQDFVELLAGQFVGKRRDAFADHHGRKSCLSVSVAICCAAASVSKLTLFHLPSRCSVIRRIFMR